MRHLFCRRTTSVTKPPTRPSSAAKILRPSLELTLFVVRSDRCSVRSSCGLT
ncbi:hypothetical protein HMPREF9565_00690 [Cutibacterium acnes HL053PA2]|nr:hypothetical protein HMPREF9565_00690 [Cutibacterium acnes HL053PA2]